MSRLDEIEARLNLLEWGDEHQQASVIDAIPADLRALLAVAKAAEALYPYASTLTSIVQVYWQPFTERGQESYTAIIQALEGIESAVKALDAKEADGV